VLITARRWQALFFEIEQTGKLCAPELMPDGTPYELLHADVVRRIRFQYCSHRIRGARLLRAREDFARMAGIFRENAYAKNYGRQAFS
jgi:hypothetical protein